MSREGEEREHPLVVKVAAGALGAAAGFAGPDAAVAGAGLAPVIEEVLSQLLGRLTTKRAERVAETLTDAAEELGGDAAEQLRRLADAAASDETYQELLARTLTIAQETTMRDKRRALSRALANALDDVGTKVDDEIAFVRMLADLDPVHIRVLKIMSRRPKHLDRVALQMNAADYPRQSGNGIRGASSRLIPALKGRYTERCEYLSSTALSGTAASSWYLIPTKCSTKYEISGYGDYLIERLAEPD